MILPLSYKLVRKKHLKNAEAQLLVKKKFNLLTSNTKGAFALKEKQPKFNVMDNLRKVSTGRKLRERLLVWGIQNVLI